MERECLTYKCMPSTPLQSTHLYKSRVMVESNEDLLYTSLNPTNNTVYRTASMFMTVSVPFICTFGLIGNSLATVTFLYRRLRHTSCNVYLAVLSMSDTLFLLNLLCVWFDSVGIGLFHVQGVCQLVIFVSYITSFLSVWCVTAITFENYIRMCRPMKIGSYCTVYRAKTVVLTLCLVAVIPYQTSLWTTGTEVIDGNEMCMTSSKYKLLYIIMTYVDTLLTFVIPLSVILFLTSCIVYSVIQCYRRRVRLQRSTTITWNTSFASTSPAKLTRLLFAVSITFVILNTPIHCIKLKMIVDLYIIENDSVNPIDAALKTVFENMYYLNFSANVVVFFICGESFRKSFCDIFCKCCTTNPETVLRNAEQQTELSLLNGSRRCTIVTRPQYPSPENTARNSTSTVYDVS